MEKPVWGPYEFHVARQARDRYQFNEALFASNGNVIFANFTAARMFAQKMNERRDLIRYPEQAVRAGQINAMGLIDEIMHRVMEHYRQERNPQVMAQAVAWLEKELGREQVDQVLRQFTHKFPPLAVYRRELEVEQYLAGWSQLEDGRTVSNREIVLEEVVMLWLANLNPAFSPFLELFDDDELARFTNYLKIMEELNEFFESQPRYGPENQNLIEMLRAPARAHPFSLTSQLDYIRIHWASWGGWSAALASLWASKYYFRMLTSLDMVKEEEKPVFFGPGPALVADFIGLEAEPERFSPDLDWMPRVVLLAKNSYVWLEQLSRKYQRFIQHLDEIPEEELEQLARWGFTGLWLIGLWERSPASKTIKHMRGNPDAVASAYSLFEYNIASDLGGEQAYQVLREKATRVGIRLSSDMVPNHMGIDSRWVIEHPEWFIALDYSPYPAYTFNGANLSWDTRVGIYLEDHYFDNTDAAVVFKRVDFHTGDTKYIYHGNDGTSFPWNDTAQLNYLLPEVREAVIQTILHVARKFPIIRFDAAMTLAKRHYQRLWFPEPGSGGDIPSRAEHGLNKAKFEEAFPEEFWRMVVDRVAQEVPETLLLAEAFWLMEGYFVRSLGMHRVYNSAFMNMLRDEKNQQYRQVIKNTVEFDPEILKRYVNFMNNPDERTAVDQFGKGDKYFGICTLMATMPGLPMFGHGQIEGYTEKYGMEFRKPMWDEQVDPYLLERHEREIFPLLRKRWLFAEVQNFLLYDVFTPEGNVNEDIYAYSNRRGDERALVIYHNKYAEARGWIRISAAMPVKAGDGERVLIQQSLGQGLELPDEIDTFVIFKDQISGLEYIHPSHDLHEKGLYVELGAYRYHVFLDFRLLRDNQWHQYAQLSAYLNGRGVPSVEAAITEILLQPILSAFNELANPGFLNWLNVNRLGVQVPRSKKESQVITPNLEAALEEAEQKMSVLLMEIKSFAGGDEPEALVAESFRKDLEMVLKLPELEKQLQIAGKRKDFRGLKFINQPPQIVSQEKRPGSLADMGMEIWGVFYGWIFMHRLGYVLPDHTPSQRRAWLDEWMVTKQLVVALMEMGLDVKKAERVARLSRLLVGREDWFDATLKPSLLSSQALKGWLSDQEVQAFLGINRFQGILWYNREAFEEWVWWIYVLAVVENLGRRTDDDPAVILHEIQQIYEIVRRILAAEKLSGYQVEKLLEAMEV